jgi:aminoglycoside phosphotransferase (APT) family kinase protein
MAGERDIYVLVPNESRDAVLVEGGKLPCVRGRRGAAGAIEAVRSAWRLETPYFRLAGYVGQGPDQIPVAALQEFDAPPVDWELPSGLAWLAVEDADAQTLALPELSPPIERWLAIAAGAPVPEQRPPWARPGWFAEVCGWLDESIDAIGLARNGSVEVVEQWAISSVLRCETEEGRVYFKAAFSIFGHEPALTRSLAAEYPMLVPEVLAVDVPRGWMLMRELRGMQIGDDGVERWSDAVAAIARIHRDWSDRYDELLAIGAQDRTLARLASEIRPTFDAVEIASDEGMASELERRCEKLALGPVPQTLVHGDFHPWNVMVDGEALRIFDWSDACISYPLFDLPTFLERAEDEGAREALLQTYLAAWGDVASAGELRAGHELSLPLACVHHAVSYLRIDEALEPDDRWVFADAPRRWLAGAVDHLRRS